MKRFFALMTILFSVLVVSPSLSMAEDKPADNMQLVREKIRADKKLFIAENMELSESQANAFWPIYDSYQIELDKLDDRTIKLIEDYVNYFESMTDEQAKQLLDQYLAIEGDRQRLRQSYLPKFRKVLPEIKVTRYYQLENKILAVVNYDLATKIPLVR